MKELFIQNPIIPIVITLIAYIISYTIYIKTKLPILTPLVTSVILVGFSLYFMKVPYSVYNESGGKFINALVGPATVVLALPIYRNLPILKANLAVILISIAIGSSIGITGIFISAKLLGISEDLFPSLLTKSVTTAIAVDITANMGGMRSITVLSVIISGVVGATIAPFVCKIFKIKSPLATGLAIGTASHAVGTSKAIEMGETEGAMSGLAIGVAGALTVVLLPILYKLLLMIWA
ncbi:LrgB family protein [Brachyspira murdochii]|uniref:LrgB family protein n=1 Tax=Brachyspira murdochii (strain ATCC 51284 / DSM 12563 / 56-150) TaxID=526224 RepID=D5UBF4_BRAM5|nr:LrgB family protein [Brachyspira murdochii]ADG72027.1 LrgB family protein [Brachyspira murdochii DSM 12563]